MINNKKIFKIRLYGSLGKEYGKDIIEVYADGVQQVFQNLCSRFGDRFKKTIINGGWHITKGRRYTSHLLEEDNYMKEIEVGFPIIEDELHIFPAIMGSGGKGGTLQIIIGAVLIILGAVLLATPFGVPLILAGVGSIVGGIVSLLTKNPTFSIGEKGSVADERPSFLFNGAVNNTEQGVPVPLVYGNHVTGTTIISAGLDTVQI